MVLSKRFVSDLVLHPWTPLSPEYQLYRYIVSKKRRDLEYETMAGLVFSLLFMLIE